MRDGDTPSDRHGEERRGRALRAELRPRRFWAIAGQGRLLQAATIPRNKPGFFEANLNRQGGCIASRRDTRLMRRSGAGRGGKDRVLCPGKPLELNFVMRPAGRVREAGRTSRAAPGRILGVAGRAESAARRRACCLGRADEAGRFSLEDIPTTYRFQFEVRKSDPKPPWDDTWASAALGSGGPEAGDLRAWFGEREIRLREFVIRVAGPGVHGRTAVAVAGNRGTARSRPRPSDGVENGATSGSPPGPPSSRCGTLAAGSEPVPGARIRSLGSAPGVEDPAGPHQARTTTGKCTISFENPAAVELVPGEHQVIFQVVVGVSQKPIREKIFRQIEARRDGRYEVPVKIPPDAIDDSRVSITFLTIQPDHDAWVRAFFHEGKGTGYKGMWQSDGGLLTAIPFAPAADAR